MKNATIEEKRALLQTKIAEAVKVQRERAEIAIIDAKINMLGNDAFINNKVRLQLQEDTMTKLKELDMQCEAIVSDMPIHSAKTRESRKWNPSRQYGMGPQMDILTGLLSGIQYSAAQHKEQMLAITGLSDVLIENTLAALGNTSYYSRNYVTVVDEVPYNTQELRGCLDIIQDVLDIRLELHRVSDSVLAHRFETARLRAERDYEEDLATRELHGQTISI